MVMKGLFGIQELESGHLWELVKVKVVQGEGGEFLNWSTILKPLLCGRPWKRMLCPSKENQIGSSGLDCSPCGEVLGEDEEGVEGGAPAPHLAIFHYE